MDYIQPIKRLSGMPDRSGEELEAIRNSIRSVSEVFSAYGYMPVDVPLLENTELFLINSGERVASSLYSFNDPDGSNVSLRPEFTASIARHFLESNKSNNLPFKAYYGGPVFRFQDHDASLRQFTQLGVELIGDGTPKADGSLVELALLALSSLGFRETSLTIGHVGIINSIYDQLTLPARLKSYFVNSLASLNEKSISYDTLRIGANSLLQPHVPSQIPSPKLPSSVLSNQDIRAVFGELYEELGEGFLCGRDFNDISTNYLVKLTDITNTKNLEKALELTKGIADLKGKPGTITKKLKAFLKEYGLSVTSVDQLARLEDDLLTREIEGSSLTIDLAMVRDQQYYSGMIFDLYVPKQSGASPIGGGGRYDALLGALGSSKQFPACGFALSLEPLIFNRKG
tara:strand:- start:2385 stop:3587 length:1203 start_codon:yes stop_codon:yes gene_type:complete